MKTWTSFLLTMLLLGTAAADVTDPAAPVPRATYRPVTSGTKTYRPVEPLPWGEVNKKVMPEQKAPDRNGSAPAPESKDTSPEHRP